MTKSKFNEEQIKELRANCNVTKCSDKAITYSKNFKIKAMKQYHDDGKSAKEIFREAGFDIGTIGEYTPKRCLRDWRRVFKIKGIDGLKIETRGKGGGRPRIKDVSDAYKIKRLEATIAYLKAENDFLAKLRAKRAE